MNFCFYLKQKYKLPKNLQHSNCFVFLLFLVDNLVWPQVRRTFLLQLANVKEWRKISFIVAFAAYSNSNHVYNTDKDITVIIDLIEATNKHICMALLL